MPSYCRYQEAGGDADRVSQLRQAMGPEFTILSGDDGLTLPFMSVGAKVSSVWHPMSFLNPWWPWCRLARKAGSSMPLKHTNDSIHFQGTFH